VSEHNVNSLSDFDMLAACLREEFINNDRKPVVITYEKLKKKRTKKQNSSLHKFLSLFSLAMNDCGLDQRVVLKPSVEIPWDKEGVQAKEKLWRPLQKAMGYPESTADLETPDITKIYEVLNRHMIEKHNLSVPFPSMRG
jgi:hypothetical protein